MQYLLIIAAIGVGFAGGKILLVQSQSIQDLVMAFLGLIISIIGIILYIMGSLEKYKS